MVRAEQPAMLTMQHKVGTMLLIYSDEQLGGCTEKYRIIWFLNAVCLQDNKQLLGGHISYVCQWPSPS